MEDWEYEKLYLLEDSHWWYVGLRDLFHSCLPQSNLSSFKILDAGCGTGGMLAFLRNWHIAYGIDISELALAKCKQRNIARIVQASVMSIPFADNSFDFVLSSDVLYHSRVDDDDKALLEFYRVLKPSGKLILQLPAFRFLRSSHDNAIHTRKRYRRKDIARMLKTVGFRQEKLSYRLFFLFPLVLLWRILMKYSSASKPRSDLWKTPAAINNLLLQTLKLENRILKRANLPFGSSIFSIASKP